MLCTRCGKNIAVVFLQNQSDASAPTQALCIKCARELGVGNIDSLIKSMGLDPDQMEHDMTEFMENTDPEQLEQSMTEMMEAMKNGDTNGFLSINPTSSSSLDSDETSDKQPFNPMQLFNSLFGSDKEKQTQAKPHKSEKAEKPDKKRKTLETFGTNLTRKAAEGKIDNIVGREREIARVIQILNRRSKNNPVLLGEPGVGKTAIAEGLAMRIVEKKVPAKLFSYEVYLIDFAALVAGTQFRGQFEARLKKLIEEATEAGNIILMIDEVHNIVGAGEAEGGAMSAANILKPALARGEIQIIGATTLTEYRKKIEKDSALERRFQPVLVDEPTVFESIEMLCGIKKYYEEYHKVVISDEVIKSAVVMSERYIHDRFLPDKAIDVIDEAASKVNLSNTQLIEIQKLETEIGDINIRESELPDEDYEGKAMLKSEACRKSEALALLKSEYTDPSVTVEDIAGVIEMWTKIPVRSITEVDSEKLIKLEENLHKRVIGQNDAVESVARAVRRNRAGLTHKKRPVSFIFAGPTGVGKTQLVKALAECMFGSEDALIRVDMSEYMEQHSVSKLIGSPPGYVGYDEAGQLTEKVRRNPYSIILLDEIEKAHADVYNIFLQVLDDGRITDSQGRVINFENTVIVMTTNAGSELKSGSMGFESGHGQSRYEKALSQIMRPEFLNRIDCIVEFNTLTMGELTQIADLMLGELTAGLAEKNISVNVTDEAKQLIATKGYKKEFGARPMRRVITRHIEDALAGMLITNSLSAGDTVEIDAKDGEFYIHKNI